MAQQRVQSRVARLFDFLVNVATVATCAIVCVVVVPRYWSTTTKGAAYLPVGAEAPQVQGVDYRSSPATMLIGIRSSCVYCSDSMPAYSELIAELTEAKRSGVRLIFVGYEEASVVSDYLAGHGLPAVAFARVAPESPFMRATPTLVVVGSDGRIRGSWLGRVDQSRVKEILRAVL